MYSYSYTFVTLVYFFGGISWTQRVNVVSMPLNRNYTRQRRDIEVKCHSFTKKDIFGVFGAITSYDREKDKRERAEKKSNTVDCSIIIKELNARQPLILHPDNMQQLYLPDETNINLSDENQLFVSCTTKQKLTLKIGESIKELAYSSRHITCVGNNMFQIDSNNEEPLKFSFSDLQCESDVEHELQISDTEIEKVKSDEYHLFRVGFQVDKTNFVPMYGGWTNLKTGSTSYVRSVIPKIALKEGKSKDDTWIALPFEFNTNNLQINDWFETKEQIKSLDFQYRCDGTDNVGVCAYHNNASLLYNRGHLTPKSAFMYKVGRSSTFTLPNAAPQVISINDRNWVNVEDQAQYLAKNGRGIKALEVITGTYGKIKIGVKKYLHLHATKSELSLRIPLYFWKLIYQPPELSGKTPGRGIVFVTLNKFIPKEEEQSISSYKKLCSDPITNFLSNDPLHIIGGVVRGFESDSTERGYTYACRVQDFLEHAKKLPDMESLLEISRTISTQKINNKEPGLLTNPKAPVQPNKKQCKLKCIV